MKKIILIAASFLINATSVKYDCFAMNNRSDELHESIQLSDSNLDQQAIRVSYIDEPEIAEQKAVFLKTFRMLKKMSEFLSNQVSDVCEEISSECLSAPRIGRIIDNIISDGFFDYQESLCSYIFISCVLFEYKTAYNKANKELVAIKNENQIQKERIEVLTQKLQELLNLHQENYNQYYEDEKCCDKCGCKIRKMAKRIHELEEENKRLRQDHELALYFEGDTDALVQLFENN